MTTLLIREHGGEFDPGTEVTAGHIELVFGAAGDHCRSVGDDGPLRWELGGDWRRIRARFAPFPLARGFVQHLLAERPQWVLVEALSGASLELARLARALGFAVAVRLPELSRLDPGDRDALRWLQGALQGMTRLLAARSADDEAALRRRLPGLPATTASPGPAPPVSTLDRFGYEAYALGRRDHQLLYAMQLGFADRFAGCRRVLDVGCGTGVFLEVLARRGIAGLGVERNAISAAFARSLGHKVVGEEALDFLESTAMTFDGVYCSHFIEHLPVAEAERLLRGVARVLDAEGIALFVFPDPESIRSQLLGFWRDPEHVRFYHPELVELLAETAGLERAASSLDAPGREVVPFSMQPPLGRPAAPAGGPWVRILRRLGVAAGADLAAARERADALEAALRQLWAVNQTWAWDDNAVLCLRRRQRP